jgi:hypothetical protein
MKLFCCYTPAHEILFTDIFAPSVSSAFTIANKRLEIAGAGDFLSAEFLECIHRKINLIIESIREHEGEIIVWSDIDIQFFDLTPDDLVVCLGDADIAFQKEGPLTNEVNTGFVVCRCNKAVESFFAKVRDGLKERPQANEQWVVNLLLAHNGADIAWRYLPLRFYARTHGWPPPADMLIYHANFTAGANGIQKKIDQFHDVAFMRRFGIVGRSIVLVKNIIRKLLIKAGIRK